MVTTATVESFSENELLVSGDLNFSSVNALLTKSTTFFKPHSKLLVNLANVSHSDSAGVALLLEWMRMAKQQDSEIFFSDIPTQMWAIIDVSELGQRLPISSNGG